MRVHADVYARRHPSPPNPSLRHLAQMEAMLGSILETLVPMMAQAGSADDAAVLLLERLVSRRSCTAAWLGRLTEHGELIGLAEVDVGIRATDVRIDAVQAMHPLMRSEE